MSSANDDTLLEDGDEEEEYDLKYEDEEALLAEIDELDDNKPQEIIGYSKKSSGRKNQYTSESNIYRDPDDAAGDDVLELYEEELDNILSTEYAEEEDYSENKDHLGGGERQNAVVYHGHSVHKSAIKIEVGDHQEVDASEVENEEGISDVVKDELMEINEEEAVRGQKDSEDEEEEEKDEGRGRFKSERTTVISLKGSKTYGNIPDTLDSVITGDEKVETGAGRWKRGGGGGRGGAGFQRGGFRGNQRGAGINFGARRKQMGRQGGHQGGGMGYAHGRGDGPPDSMRDVIGPPPSQYMQSQNVHFNPHFKGNILPPPEGPPWNEGPMGNVSHSSGGGPQTHFHDLQRFPPPLPAMGGGYGGDHRGPDMLPPTYGEHHRQPRQRSPPPPMHSAYHSVPGGRSGEYDSPPGHHPDYLRDDPYDNRRSAHPGDGWNGGPGQRMPEGSIGGGGVHHGYGHFPMSPGMHGERGGGGGEMPQHFRPTIQPGPLFSHVAPPSVAPPSSGGMPPDQQGHMMHQQPPHHLQNMMRLAPPLHGGGGGGGGMGQHMMQQMPPQDQPPHGRIPPPGFSPNEGRSMQSMHHGMQMPWNDPPINRSPLGGQHMSQQQHQQQSPFHLGGGAPRPYLPGDRPGGIPGGSPMHHHPSVGSMSAPPPPFLSGNVQQGPHPAHSMQHSPIRQGNFNSSSSAGPGGGNSGGHNNGRFPRQGNMGNFQQQPGFSRAPPPHQSVRPNRGAGHMSQGRGGMGARRGMGTPNTRPMAPPKPVGEDAFPPKRPSLQDNPSQAIKVSPPKKRKVRKIVKNNLLEVETVDTLPDTTTTSDKEANAKEADNSTKPAAPLDPEVLEYQKKIERQKQLREEVLRRKEQRRKLMALQKQKELQEKAALSGETTSEVPKGNAIATIVNRNTVEPSPTLIQPNPIINKEPVANQSFVAPMNPGQPTPEAQANQAQLLAARKKALLALKAVRAQHGAQPMGRGMAIRGMRGGMGSQMVNQQIRSQNLVTVANSPMSIPQQQMSPRTKIIQVKNEEGQLVRKKVAIHPVMGGRVVPMGRGQGVEGSPQPGRPIAQGRGQVVVSAQGQQVQTPAAIQRVVQMLPPQQGITQSPEPKAQVNKMIQRVVKVNVPVPNQQQLLGRKVVVQGVGGAGGAGDCISADSPMPTGSVVVENLAVTTTEADLRKMCMTVGRVKSIRMVPGKRSAWVEFAHPNSAATFCQRYQRKIVDLSMITVRLANS